MNEAQDKRLWIGLAIVALLPISVSLLPLAAPIALVAGIIFGLTLGASGGKQAKSISRTLLQTSVVLLGLGMDARVILKAGADGLGFSLLSILVVFSLGWLIQRLLEIRPITGLLVSTGTAICGGSAIAAMSTVVDAPDEDVSVSVGTVFLLNAVALFIFPPLGHLLGLTETQFGIWAGISIHDIASVVGAGTAFGGKAVEIATAVKLSRVLYLIPITLIAAGWAKRENQGKPGKVTVPWFIGVFLLACLLRSLVPAMATIGPVVKVLATAGLAGSLFLIGSGMTKESLKQVGVRPLIMGILLWIAISVGSFFFVRLIV